MRGVPGAEPEPAMRHCLIVVRAFHKNVKIEADGLSKIHICIKLIELVMTRGVGYMAHVHLAVAAWHRINFKNVWNDRQ